MRIPPPSAPIRLPNPADGPSWLVIANTDPPAPVWDRKAMLALLPAWARQGDLAVRDALLKAWGLMANLWWAQATRLMHSQTSPRFAEGRWLEWWGQRLQRPRVAGESDGAYRARLLAHPGRISLDSIVTAVEALCREEGVEVYFQQPLEEGLFFSGPSDTWSDYYSGAGQRWWGDEDDDDGDYVRRGVFWGGSPYAPRLRVILKMTSGWDDDTVFLGGETMPATDADFFSGGVLGTLGFWSGGSSLDERVAAEMSARAAGGVKWEIYYEPLA